MEQGPTMLGLFKLAKGPGHMALGEAPVPRPAPNEVLLEVKACGICGTDIHIRHDQFPYWPPVIMGHEFTGVVIETGSDVRAFAVGDRVVGEPHTRACGQCYLCRTGNIQICAQKRSPGWGIHGGFARYLTLPEHLLHRLPAHVSFEAGALVEPAANVVQDVIERGGLQAGDNVVITGPGPIGLLAVMVARAGGAAQVLVTGSTGDENRLALARELGADAAIGAGQQDPVQAVLERTGGRGADLVVEASGAPAAVAGAVQMVRRMGRITAIGLTGREQIPFPWDLAVAKVCTLIFNLSTGFTCWDRTINLIASGKLPVHRLITHVAPLAEWEQVFDDVESRRAIKALLVP